MELSYELVEYSYALKSNVFFAGGLFIFSLQSLLSTYSFVVVLYWHIEIKSSTFSFCALLED